MRKQAYPVLRKLIRVHVLPNMIKGMGKTSNDHGVVEIGNSPHIHMLTEARSRVNATTLFVGIES